MNGWTLNHEDPKNLWSLRNVGIFFLEVYCIKGKWYWRIWEGDDFVPDQEILGISYSNALERKLGLATEEEAQRACEASLRDRILKPALEELGG